MTILTRTQDKKLLQFMVNDFKYWDKLVLMLSFFDKAYKNNKINACYYNNVFSILDYTLWINMPIKNIKTHCLCTIINYKCENISNVSFKIKILKK